MSLLILRVTLQRLIRLICNTSIQQNAHLKQIGTVFGVRLTMSSVQMVLLVRVLAYAAGLDVLARERELVLGQAHGAEEVYRVFPLGFFAC